MSEREKLFAEAEELGIEFKKNISSAKLKELIAAEKANKKLEGIVPTEEVNEEQTMEDLILTAKDLGISVAKNSTHEWLVASINTAIEENRKDEIGRFFTAVGNDCFIASEIFKVDIPYRIDEWENNEYFMAKFETQIKAGTLKWL